MQGIKKSGADGNTGGRMMATDRVISKPGSSMGQGVGGKTTSAKGG